MSSKKIKSTSTSTPTSTPTSTSTSTSTSTTMHDYYSIKQSFRPQPPKTTGNSIVVEDFGSFETTLDMKVQREKPLPSNYGTDDEGYLVQEITKTTETAIEDPVDPDKLILLNTENAVSVYTSNNVIKSKAKYYELFKIKINGNEAVDGDIFGSGAIAEYNAEDVNLNKGSKYGLITQIGRVVFIHKNNPFYATLLGYPWQTSEGHPSHGLPFIDTDPVPVPVPGPVPFNPANDPAIDPAMVSAAAVAADKDNIWNMIQSHSDSGEPTIHLVTVAWTEKKNGRQTTNPTKVRLDETINKDEDFLTIVSAPASDVNVLLTKVDEVMKTGIKRQRSFNTTFERWGGRKSKRRRRTNKKRKTKRRRRRTYNIKNKKKGSIHLLL
jgi:hypothetical protein